MTRIAARPALGEAAAAPGTAGGGGGDGGGERAGGGEGGASASPGRGAGGSTATPPQAPPAAPQAPAAGGGLRPPTSMAAAPPPTAAPGSTAAGPVLGAGGDAAGGAASRAATRAHGSPGPSGLRAPRDPQAARGHLHTKPRVLRVARPPPCRPPLSSLLPPSPARGTPRGAAGAGRHRSRAQRPAGAHLGESGRAAGLASPGLPCVESARSRLSFPPQSPVEDTHSSPEVGHVRALGNWGPHLGPLVHVPGATLK